MILITYFFDFIKNITKKSNAGLLVYLILNVLVVIFVFANIFTGVAGIFIGVITYIASLILVLSPVGEWVLRLQAGCRKIKRRDHIDRLEPLFAEAFIKAKQFEPSITDDIQLFISGDKEPNAFATGRKTICLTKGLLDFTDEQIKAVFAHELAHLAHKDTDLILMITVGNFIVTGFFILYKIFFYTIGLTVALINRSIFPIIMNIFMDLILVGLIWIWTKIGILLVMHSSRQNEYLADEFAYKCGYGNSLVTALDALDVGNAKGLWATLASTHPNIDDRVARLQELESMPTI